jgi:ABC-2 type transport system ATP-binding protein
MPATSSAGSVIDVRGLRKSYGDIEVVRGIDLNVRRGEVFAFLGPNGAGKTTTVEILEGYRERSGGEVAVLGSDPQHAGGDWRARIGLVLQSTTMPAELSVHEIVDLYASFYPHPRSIEETIDLVGLAKKRDARADSLSGGQVRRLEVALALIGDPELVFLDEPTTGFDPAARHQAWEMVSDLRSLGTTIFLTTHYMDEAQHLADRVAVIVAGQIVAEGTPDSLGGAERAVTRIAFGVTDGFSLEALPERLRGEAALAGTRVEVRTSQPARAVAELSRWALDRGDQLDDLTVGRPTLEDVYLQLTGDAVSGE